MRRMELINRGSVKGKIDMHSLPVSYYFPVVRIRTSNIRISNIRNSKTLQI